MNKYCKPMGLYVTYLDCMDCEDKECRKKQGCKYGRVFTSTECKLCTEYGKCKNTERRTKTNEKNISANRNKSRCVFGV